MKSTSHKPPLRQGSSDIFQTPPYALKPLLPYIPKDWVIWECAAGHGMLVDEFKRLGYNVIGTDILEGHDFLKRQPTEHWDCIITNPPYSLKQQFLQRCYDFGKPFALLLPLTTFETQKRQALFKRHGLEVVLFDKRINFVTPSGKGGGAWFATAWFTNGLGLPQQLNYERLEVE